MLGFAEMYQYFSAGRIYIAKSSVALQSSFDKINMIKRGKYSHIIIMRPEGHIVKDIKPDMTTSRLYIACNIKNKKIAYLNIR